MRLSELINSKLHQKWDKYTDHLDAKFNPEAYSEIKRQQKISHSEKTNVVTKAKPEEETFINQPESLDIASPGHRGLISVKKRAFSKQEDSKSCK